MIKRLLLLLLLLSLPLLHLEAQHFPFSWFNRSESYQYALDFNGSTEYLSCTPALRLTGEYSLYDNFSDGNYDGWTVSSGAYSVVDSTPLSGGTKALKCTTAGVISIPCNQVYGQWEFDWYKGADANTFLINFMLTNEGYRYRLQFTTDEGITLWKYSSALFSTGASYFSNNTWYRIKITRNTNGSFITYIKGGAFGSTYVLISVTGGYGANPITENTFTYSDNFNISLQANDMIANIVCQQGEGSLDLNSYERIYHSNNRTFEDTTGFRWATNGTHSIVRNTDGTTGSNLVPDSASTFNTGGATWWNSSGGTLSRDSDSTLKFSIAGAGTFIYKNMLTANASYKYSIKIKSNAYSSIVSIYGGVATYGSTTGNITNDWQTFTGHFKTTDGVFYITFLPDTADIYFDNIVVEKIDSKTGYSGKLISTDVGDSTTNYVSLPAVNFDTLKQDANGVYEKYTLEGWARGTGILNDTNKVENGTFDKDTLWVLGAGVTIGSGTLNYATSGSTINSTTVNLTVGKVYRLKFTVSNHVNGRVQAQISAQVIYSSPTPNGTYSIDFTASYSTPLVFYSATGVPTNLSVDNITLQEITQPSITLKIGNQVKTVTGISCVPATFTKFVFNFQSNALVSNQPIQLYLNQADTCYIDDVSLTKGYDLSLSTFANNRGSASQGLIENGELSTGIRYGFIYSSTLTTLQFRTGDGVSVIGTGQTSYTPTTSYSLISGKFNRLDSSNIFLNGVKGTPSVQTTHGKIQNTAFRIGALNGTLASWNGQIGHVRITKFTDISQSNVNSTTLTTAYNRGKLIQGEWTGGTPIEVAFYDWKGSTTNEILSDKSGTGNNLTGTNMDINDRIKVRGKFK